MAKVQQLENGAGELIDEWLIDCPACKMHHSLKTNPEQSPCWVFNGDVDQPTFHPSLLVRWTYGIPSKSMVCHSWIKDGTIQFLNDCTHALAGQTVPLNEVER